MNVSVLVATFGSEEWGELGERRAVFSAINQGAHEILHVHDPVGTVCTTRNAVAQKATGDWLCFLDADDELAPGYVGAMGRAVEREGTDGQRLLLTPAISPPNLRAGRLRRGVFNPVKNLADQNWLVIGTLIERDFFWELGGFDERTPHGLEDWQLWSKADAAGARVVKVPDAVYVAHTRRVSSHAVFARSPEYGREYDRIRREIHPELYAHEVQV